MNAYGDDVANYVTLKSLARDRCGLRGDYVRDFLLGLDGCPNLGEGIRRGCPMYGPNKSVFFIHKDDADEFVSRIRKYHKDTAQGWWGEEEP